MRIALLLASALSASAAWEEGNGFRRMAVQPEDGRPGFTLLTNAAVGVAFTNRISETRAMERHYLFNGAGVAVGDFDGDGKPDIFFCNKEGPCALYRNVGNWRFEDVTAKAGVACADQSSVGATFADINGDGWVDLLVTSFGGPNACFLNQRNGTFTNVTESIGFSFRGQMTSLALGDVDGDGFLDLYAAVFPTVSVLRDGVSMATRMVNGVAVPSGRYANRVQILNGQMVEVGEPHLLFRNSGGSKFNAVAWPETFFDEGGKGMNAPPDFGLAVQMRDIDGDGIPDIYVCNDFQTPDRMWLNDGKGKFRTPAPQARRSMSYAAMGVDFADIDRDGDMDIMVVEMLATDPLKRLCQANQNAPYARTAGASDNMEEAFRNTLYLNNGDGTYSEIARLAGVAASDWSWCPIFLDVDLDGYEDLLITNGNPDDLNDMDGQMSAEPSKGKRTRPFKPLITANRALRNQHDLTFADSAAAWGFDSKQISHGMALGDFDGDGDLDVVVNCWNAPPLIYKNNGSAPRILTRLKGKAPNTQGIGALVTLRNAAGFAQSQEIICGGRYLSGDDPARTFACVGQGPFELEVRWRSGRVSKIANAAANSIYEVDEPETAPVARPKSAASAALFADVSEKLAHAHRQEDMEDFARAPLLPRKISQYGPAVVAGDLNGDGRPDLVVGGDVLLNSEGGFKKIEIPKFNGDPASVVILPGATPKIIFATDRLVMTDLKSIEEIKTPMTPGALALIDIDHDGDLDLFVGARGTLERFPEGAESRIFLNENGNFKIGKSVKAGMVNGVVAADFNGDGWTDLAVASEWGEIKVLLNKNGEFSETVLSKPGLWMSLATADLDGDGKPDLIAGNWGRNCEHEAFRATSARLYYGDWMRRGVFESIEAEYSQPNEKWIPVRSLPTLGTILPFLKERYQTHALFASAGVESMMQGHELKFVEAATFESTVFLNRGDHWEAKPLPIQAQFTPSLGAVAADFDGDGKVDLFMAQNYFATRTDVGRYDAGFGLLLRGDGHGNFTPVPANASGVRALGEQRGVAAIDFDGDGKTDLVVTQNGASTKLFRNTGAK